MGPLHPLLLKVIFPKMFWGLKMKKLHELNKMGSSPANAYRKKNPKR